LVKPISNLIIRDEQDIHDVLTNREKLENLIEEYERKQLDREVCCDENAPCVPTTTYHDNSNNENIVLDRTTTIPSLITVKGKKEQHQVFGKQDFSHKGENSHSKNIDKQSVKELDVEHLKPNTKAKIQEDFEKSHREQQILLKQNKQSIIDFLLCNKDSIRVEDLKIYEPIYKCYREKRNCYICNTITNIICINCCNYNYNDKDVWLCTNHWQQHAIENHDNG
jgi:hypothetical protein